MYLKEYCTETQGAIPPVQSPRRVQISVKVCGILEETLGVDS